MSSVSHREFYEFKKLVLSRLEELELGGSPPAVEQTAPQVQKADIPTIDTALNNGGDDVPDEWNGISPGIVTLLKSVGLESPAAVAAMSDDDILAVKGLGQKSLTEIREKLDEG